jgi:hypothetical protein
MCLNPVLELLNICIGRLRLVTIRLSFVRETVICWLVRLGLKRIRLASAGHYTTDSGEGDGNIAGFGWLVRFGLKWTVLMIGPILFAIMLSGPSVAFLTSRLDVHCTE